MLSLPSRALALTSIYPFARHFAAATLPTRHDTPTVDRVQATSDSSKDQMDQITDILNDADLSASPRSNNFSGKPLVASASQLSPLSSWHPSWPKV